MRTWIAAGCVLFLAGGGWAQESQDKQPSLPEVAEKEKQRRAASKAAKGSFDNYDLWVTRGRTGVVVDEQPLASTGEAGPARPTAVKTEEQVKAERSAEIQKRIDDQAKLKAMLQKAIAEAQIELGDLTNYTYGPKRASLMDLVEQGTAEIVLVDQRIAEAEEEARRAGLRVSVPR